MKSIIEQASSIIKAIEKAWNQAEKPGEFSIKIYEQEERNFFGMSTKPAKIGIFFGNDKPNTHEKPIVRPQQKIKECKAPFAPSPSKTFSEQNKTENRPAPSRTTEDKVANKPATKSYSAETTKDRSAQPRQTAPQTKQAPQSSKSTAPITEKAQQPQAADLENKTRRVSTTWNDTMITTTHNWLKQTLSLMGLPAVGFTSEVAGKNLKLTFISPLIADPIQEKQLFRSFAHLIVSSLRNQYKQEIKNLKVVLIRPE